MTSSVITGLILGGGVLLCTFAHPLAFATLVSVAIGIAIWEITLAFKKVGINTPVVICMVASVLMVFSAHIGGLTTVMLTYLVACGCIMIYSVFEKSATDRHSSYMVGIFVLTYLPLMLSFYMGILEEPKGPLKLIWAVLAIVASDTGGLLVGSRIGMHKLAPSISPKKTWEGLAGSFIFGIITCYGYAYFVFPSLFYSGRGWVPLVFAICAVILGTIGDLAESIIKRDAKIKDIGGILPGHGGILDRLDSLLFFAPFAYYFMLVMV